MAPGDDKEQRNLPGLEDLLSNIEKSKPLDELLNEVMDKELQKQYKVKEERKQRIIQELVNASKIYEKMPLDRLAIKLNEDINEILDLLEQIILNNEFTGIAISGKELMFTKIQRKDELDQKPFLVVSTAVVKPSPTPAFRPQVEPLKRKKIDLQFKVLKDKPVEQVSVESENLIVEPEVTPVAAQVQLKLNLTNNTAKNFENVLIKFLMQGTANLMRMKPSYAVTGEFQNEIIVPSVPANSNRRILLYFAPMTCEPLEFDILVQYKDPKGNFIDENLAEKITITNPVFAKKPAISKEEFQAIITQQLKFKAIKSYGIPASLNPTDAYLIIKEILITNEFEFVGEKLIEDKNQYLGWYYTSFKEAEKLDDFIVIGQVLNKKMEFFAMGNNATQLLSGITHLAKALRTALIDRGIIKGESNLVELVCPSCGGVLERNPAPGEIHACKFCGAKLQF